MNDYEFKDMRIGRRETFSATVTEKMMAAFLETTGDLNPIHQDDAFAREHGFTSKVAYGLLTGSFYSTLTGVYLPGRRALLHGIEISFHKPVYVGDVLAVSGEVCFLNEAYRQIEVRAQIVNQSEECVSKAKIKVGFYA